MAKNLTGLWLKNIKRMGRAQQKQGRKLLQSLLLPKVVRSPSVRRTKTVKPVGPPAIKRSGQSSAMQARFVARFPGSWQKAYFPSTSAWQPAPAQRMLYWLYLPAGASAGAAMPRPLVVMLHGCQQTAADFATATRMNELAERKGFAVLYPQQSATTDSHRCWHWYQRATQQGLGDVSRIAGMIAQVQRKHGLDASRTYVAGLSAGAAMAMIVALQHPELIAAVGLHSAPVFGTSDSPVSAYRTMQHGSGMAYREAARAFSQASPPFPGMPALLIHGKRDPVVQRINVEQLVEQFRILNAASIGQSEPVLRSHAARVGGRSPRHAYKTVTYHADRKPELVHCEIDALGHAWSGGDTSVAFSEPEGPDATLMMWNFFAQHQRVSASSQS
ncbi:MAG: extracellular catalytic domain type 1 short-chain-length polyhydroxyalkanoate depolymerase [Polaromonas sp.]